MIIRFKSRAFAIRNKSWHACNYYYNPYNHAHGLFRHTVIEERPEFINYIKRK